MQNQFAVNQNYYNDSKKPLDLPQQSPQNVRQLNVKKKYQITQMSFKACNNWIFLFMVIALWSERRYSWCNEKKCATNERRGHMGNNKSVLKSRRELQNERSIKMDLECVWHSENLFILANSISYLTPYLLIHKFNVTEKIFFSSHATLVSSFEIKHFHSSLCLQVVSLFWG